MKNQISVNVNKKTWMDINQVKVNLKRDKNLYIMLIPFLTFFIVFKYIPMYGLQIAFKEYSVFKGILESPWAGVENFITFFKGPYFFRTLRNTVVISGYALLINFPIPIILALLFNEVRNKGFKKFSQSVVYIPHFISTVVVAGLVTTMLSPEYGIVNLIISKFGGEKVYFLTKPEYFRPIYITMNAWKEAGFSSIIFASALAGINVQLYEAAAIDGAGKWKQLIHVTLPGILPTIVTMFIINIGNILNVGYESIILLYQPATYETADVISTYVYRAGLIEGQYSLSTAVDLFNGLVGLILVAGANTISKKVTETSLW